MRKNKGFTLVELLVVIAIIGLLSTLAVVALNSARAKARDARRVSDIKQVQLALDMFMDDMNSYPSVNGTALGIVNAACLGTSGFGAAGCGGGDKYMAVVPANPSPGGTNYTYTSTGGGTYQITFQTENTMQGLQAGTLHTATENSMK